MGNETKDEKKKLTQVRYLIRYSVRQTVCILCHDYRVGGPVHTFFDIRARVFAREGARDLMKGPNSLLWSPIRFVTDSVRSRETLLANRQTGFDASLAILCRYANNAVLFVIRDADDDAVIHFNA